MFKQSDKQTTVPAPLAYQSTAENHWVKYLLIMVALSFLGFFLFIPLFAVFAQALAGGWRVYLGALRDPAALAAIKLTLLAAGIALPLNTLFGLAAAWSIAKFEFRGK